MPVAPGWLPPPASIDVPQRVLARSLLFDDLTYAHPLRRGDIGWARLFERQLHGGKPLRALAFGSSITAVFGGCTASLFQNCSHCCGTVGANPRGQAALGYGYLRRPVEWLNRTWPHAEHRLWNAAQPATSLQSWGDCLAAWMPRPLDLVILELGGARTGNTAAGLVRLVRNIEQLLGRDAPPAVLVVSFFRWAGPPPAANAPLPHYGRGSGSDAIAADLARRYGWLVVSEEKALLPETVVPRRADAVLWPSVKQADGVHPVHGRGPIFYGSLVTHAFYRAHEAWAAQRDRRAAAATPGPLPELPPNRHRHHHSSLPPPLPGGVGACYTLNAAPRSDRWRADRLPRLTRRDGWEFVQWENRSANPHKPGLLATTAGAVVDLQVLPVRSAQRLPGGTASESGEVGSDESETGGDRGGGDGEQVWSQMDVCLRYLVSYAHQGTARVSCRDGCGCAAHVINAHRPAFRESVQEEDAFRVEMAPPLASGAPARCTLRVEVLPSSASGEHELKLYGLTLQDAGTLTRERASAPEQPLVEAAVGLARD